MTFPNRQRKRPQQLRGPGLSSDFALVGEPYAPIGSPAKFAPTWLTNRYHHAWSSSQRKADQAGIVRLNKRAIGDDGPKFGPKSFQRERSEMEVVSRHCRDRDAPPSVPLSPKRSWVAPDAFHTESAVELAYRPPPAAVESRSETNNLLNLQSLSADEEHCSAFIAVMGEGGGLPQ